MKHKKIILIIYIALLNITIISLVVFNTNLKGDVKLVDKKEEIVSTENVFAIMVENEERTGYVESDSDIWPGNMALNKELSYCKDKNDEIVENPLTYENEILTIRTNKALYCYLYFYDLAPRFTYTGDYELVDDADNIIPSADGNWKIRFLTSGTLTFTTLAGAEKGIDVFLVGGGGGGAGTTYGGMCAAGGGGGYTTTGLDISVNTNVEYEIAIGGRGKGGSGNSSGGTGGTSSAFSLSAAGGKGATSKVYGVGTFYSNGGSGGSGGGGAGDRAGNGGNNGNSGGGGCDANCNSWWTSGGSGQGTTTKEFGEDDGTLYAGGGGGGGNGAANSIYNRGGLGGAGGGGTGGGYSGNAGITSGEDNTGGGGGGSHMNSTSPNGKDGGTGIVIIRNARG